MTVAKNQYENGHVAASATVVDQGDALPPWLDSTPSGNGNGHKASPQAAPASSEPTSRNDEPAETFSLISEDDLPEWLRALGDQEFEAEAPSTASFTNKAASEPRATTSAPTISRAWLSRPRDAEPESAGQVAADFTPLESGPTAGLTRRTTPQVDEQTQTESAAPVAPGPAAVVEDESAQPDAHHVRLIMLSVVVLLVVILGVYALTSLL